MPRSTQLSRAAVVQAAASLADAAGSAEQVTLAQVAAHFGIRLPSLYNYVDGLPDLRRALALLGVQELTAARQGAAVGRAGDDAIVAIAQAYRAYAQARPGRYSASVRAAGPDEHELIAASTVLIELLLRVLTAYRLQGDDALHAVRGLRSIVHGFVSLEAAGGFGMPLDRDESFGRLIAMFLAGLRQASYHPTPSPPPLPGEGESNL